MDIDIVVYDEILTEEDVLGEAVIEINVYDEALASESFECISDIYYIDVIENVALMVDLAFADFTPKYINVNENVINLVEYINLVDIVVEQGLSYDVVSVSEYVRMAKSFTFNDILRTYPFIVRTKTGMATAEFESGVIQERDIWGRQKKEFEINFPPMNRYEALDVEGFYMAYKGTRFTFVNPVDGLPYTVRIIDEIFSLERRYFDTYYGKLVVEEVF